MVIVTLSLTGAQLVWFPVSVKVTAPLVISVGEKVYVASILVSLSKEPEPSEVHRVSVAFDSVPFKVIVG